MQREEISEVEVPEAALTAAILAAAAVYGDAPDTALKATGTKYRRSRSAVAGALFQLGFASREIGRRVLVSETTASASSHSNSTAVMAAVAAAARSLDTTGVHRPFRVRPAAVRPLGADVPGAPSGDCTRHLERVRAALGGMMFPVLAV